MTKYITYINVVLCTTISCTPTRKNRNQNDCHCVRAYMNIQKKIPKLTSREKPAIISANSNPISKLVTYSLPEQYWSYHL